jgi:class 3 adenylate cyclase/DNA-binding CsgD family transcriptional regulator
MAAALFAFALHVDLRDQLPVIHAPTTVIHRRGDLIVRFAQGRELAAHIPGARLVPLEGEDHIPWLGDAGAAARALAEALGDPSPALVADTADVAGFGGTAAPAPRAEAAGPPPAQPGPAGLRIVLFTDAEGSTALTARLGDEVAREPLRALERLTHEAVRAHGGVELKSLGDGVMASFASATAALRCAVALQRGLAAHNERAVHPLRVRVGINAGEPIEEGADLFGATVNAAARIVHLAEGGEVLVADVVRQLAAGKGFLFADRGAHALRGFEDPTRLWELACRPGVAAPAAPAPDGLTPREIEVLRLIAAGRSTRAIADALVISIGTVERHVTNLYAKIGARGRADAAAYAFRHHLATPDAP